MKVTWIILLIFVGFRVFAAPQEKDFERRAGTDLLSTDYVHTGHGKHCVILPDKTPFDSDPAARKRYQQAFVAGFESGFSGVLRPYASKTQPTLVGEVEGWSAGQWSGYRAHQKESILFHKSGQRGQS